MIYLQLVVTFFKIGLFSFGGGYAMIPLIGSEIEAHGWMTPAEFANIIAVAEMTPGPIAINSATFVGWRTSGLIGGLVATTGVVLPSVILVLLLSHILLRFQNHWVTKGVLYGIRPVVVALVAAAALVVAETSILTRPLLPIRSRHLTGLFEWPALAIAALSYLLMVRAKLHPILIMLIAAGAGLALHVFGLI